MGEVPRPDTPLAPPVRQVDDPLRLHCRGQAFEHQPVGPMPDLPRGCGMNWVVLLLTLVVSSLLWAAIIGAHWALGELVSRLFGAA